MNHSELRETSRSEHRDPVQRLGQRDASLDRMLLSEAPQTLERAAKCDTVWVRMRDGVQLATDVYFPVSTPAPAIAVRTPYGRTRMRASLEAIAAAGFVVIAQDCRGTGDSAPDVWDTYVYEREDSYDLVEWVIRQPWYDGFLGGCGGSYLGSTQWAMAMHARMSAIAPEVAGLVIHPTDMPRYYMLVNAYSRSVGKGADKVPVSFGELEQQMIGQTLAGGFFNAPLEGALCPEVWERYPEIGALAPTARKAALRKRFLSEPPSARAALIKAALGQSTVTLESLDDLTSVFGHERPVGLYINPAETRTDLVQSLRAPALVVTGWYDWGLADTLATWDWIERESRPEVKARSRLLIAPSAHNCPGYHENTSGHPELALAYRTPSVSEGAARTADIRGVILSYYRAVREERVQDWPKVIFYKLGENAWYSAGAWPPTEARTCELYLDSPGVLGMSCPQRAVPDHYVYDPENPTPTVGGSIISYVYPPGSVDVSAVQRRSDVLTYTTPPLARDLDVVGPVRLVLFARSSAVDTDFAGRLSDVFPDGRTIQLQNGVLRARYRNPQGPAERLDPRRTYRFEIDLWATANRFKAGHRIRLDISSADFPRLDRNSNRGGESGSPIKATQTIFHDAQHPSHLVLSVIGSAPAFVTELGSGREAGNEPRSSGETT